MSKKLGDHLLSGVAAVIHFKLIYPPFSCETSFQYIARLGNLQVSSLFNLNFAQIRASYSNGLKAQSGEQDRE